MMTGGTAAPRAPGVGDDVDIEHVVSVVVTGAWAASGAAVLALRGVARTRLPPGCVRVPARENGGAPPGSKLVRGGILAAMTVNLGMVLLAVLEPLPGWGPGPLAVPLADGARVVGLVGYAAHLAWGVAVMYFNPTYTPCFRLMRPDAVLATGGPYRWSRHPYYLGHVVAAPFISLLSGTWPPLVGALLLIALLPAQAAAEERWMASRFGEAWQRYAAVTGRWLARPRGELPDGN